MKIILITGLDGSGKSTLLDQLDAKKNADVDILRLPTFSLTTIPKSFSAYNLCNHVNKLNQYADMQQVPFLKIISLFSSMMIFKDLLDYYKDNGTKILICERHPLIDMEIYASVYLPYMDPNQYIENDLKQIDELFKNELQELYGLLSSDQLESNLSFTFLAKTHSFFTTKNSFYDLSQPDEIHFLTASTQTLINRIQEREFKEVHETKQKLNYLAKCYQKKLSNFTNVRIHLSEKIEDLEKAQEIILKSLV